MSEDGRPNILCFVTDQQRADHLGCYGNTTVQTPNIDRIAAEGVTFNHAYVSNPLCMPNRASLFTGMVPKAHGVRENGIALDRSHPVLPELLRQAGYQTGSFGKLHLTPFAIDQHTPLEDWESYETPGYWSYQDHIPTPYYGFEQVYYVGGHGPYTFGEYVNDIRPNAHRRLGIDAALESPSGAKESWKASIAEADHYNTRIADKTIDFLRNRAESPTHPFVSW
jgi:arylsulfatase A-like enzyme